MNAQAEAIETLLVDDDNDWLDLLERKIEAIPESQYRIVRANSGNAAIQHLVERPVDLCLIDIRLGGLDGFETVRQMYRHRPHCPIILMTGLDEAEHIEVEAVSSGATDLLYKDQIAQGSLRRVMSMARLRKESERKLTEAALTDLVTGVHNRWYFFTCLEAEFERFSRHHSDLSILFIDLDNFKAVNDEHGHVVGDRVVESVGQALLSCARRTDMVARYGGDEFVVLLTNADLEHAAEVADKFLNAVRGAGEAAGTLPITASIGVASTSQGYLEAEALIAAADDAAYLAKSAGRDQVKLHSLDKKAQAS